MKNQLLLVERIADSVRDYIETEQLESGDRLPSEADMLALHGVSRSVLREAINRLNQIGLVEVRRGKGMFVGSRDAIASCLQFARTTLSISPREMVQFGELRCALECWAVRRAADLATGEQIEKLDRLVYQLDGGSRNYDDSIQIDFELHRLLFEIADIPLVTNLISLLQQFVLEGMTRTTPEPRDHDVSQRLHRAIVDAIRQKDPEAAEKAMRTHMRVTIDRLASQVPK